MRVQRHGDLAGAHQVGAGSRINGLFQDVAASPLCDAQHVGGQRRHQLIVVTRHHRDMADNGVALQRQTDEARPRRLGQFFHR